MGWFWFFCFSHHMKFFNYFIDLFRTYAQHFMKVIRINTQTQVMQYVVEKRLTEILNPSVLDCCSVMHEQIVFIISILD